MIFELDLYLNQSVKKAYFQNFLMDDANLSKIIHNHNYAEIHLCFGGEAEMLVGNETFVCRSGNVCLIPAKAYHCYLKADPETRIFAFQIDLPASAFEVRELPEQILAEIVRLVTNEAFEYRCGSFQSLLCYVASSFSADDSAAPTKDYAVAIYDFISKNYNRNITLGDLAQNLCFSEKQTERLVKKAMGCTFKKALISYKMIVADFLEKNTDMTQTEIAHYVGYSNYSGYLKSKKAFRSADRKAK